MDQYQVEVYIPLLEKSFDMYISANSQIYNVVRTIVQYLDSIQSTIQFGLMECVLCNLDNGVVYNYSMTTYEAGIKNGSKLMIM